MSGAPQPDEKIKTAAGKAPLALVPAQSLVGPARVYGYGSRKYSAGNFWNADLSDGAGARYVGAALRHLSEMQLPNGLHSPESLATLDEESGLPHLDHVLCGLMMLRSIMVKCGALPVDPGVGKDPTTVAQRALAYTSVAKAVLIDGAELPTETLLREARVANGAFDVGPTWKPRPTGPGETGADFGAPGVK